MPADWNGAGNPSEEIILTELRDCSFEHNFVGIKLGDLNNTLGVNAGAEEGGMSSVGRSRLQAFATENVTVVAGDEVTVSITLPEAAKYIGGQAGFYLNNRALTLLDYSSPDLGEDNYRAAENPVRATTRIGLKVAADQVAKLKITDISGRMLLRQAHNYRSVKNGSALMPEIGQ